MAECGLTDRELKEFAEIIKETIDRLIICADTYNIDRDSLMKYFAETFSTMCEISTFEHYEEG